MPESVTVTLGSHTAILRPLTSVADAVDLSILRGRSEAAAAGAALGLTWPGKPPWGRVRLAEHSHDLRAYGRAVFDLACAVAPPLEVYTVGQTALLVATSILPTAEEEESALGNSEGPVERTSGPSSPSAASTVETSTGGEV